MKKITLPILIITLLTAILAFPATVSAKTNWDLEGWRVDAGKWMDGLLFTYYEDDWVPYRLEANKYDGVDTVISVQHDYMDSSGHIGIDKIKNVYIGPTTPRTTTPESLSASPWTVPSDGYFSVSTQSIVEVPNGFMIEYSFTIPDPAALVSYIGTNDFAIYWEAHCSLTGDIDVEYGSSYWNGASLHAHTSVTGNQDVPIKTPPESGPSPDPSIDIIKQLSVCGGDWLDADEYYYVSQSDEISFKIVVTNTGNVELTNIQLEDIFVNQNAPDDFTNLVWTMILDFDYPTTLLPGESFTVMSDTYVAGVCWHTNTATVCGEYDNSTYTNTDVAKYKGN